METQRSYGSIGEPSFFTRRRSGFESLCDHYYFQEFTCLPNPIEVEF
jgi:hypothetical protein